MNFSRNKIFNLKVCRNKPFISGFGPNPIEHRAKTGRLHCLLHSFSCVLNMRATLAQTCIKPSRILLLFYNRPPTDNIFCILTLQSKKSRMRETLNISTCADSSNNTRKLRNKPAVQAAGADPYQCNSSTMQNQDKL